MKLLLDENLIPGFSTILQELGSRGNSPLYPTPFDFLHKLI